MLRVAITRGSNVRVKVGGSIAGTPSVVIAGASAHKPRRIVGLFREKSTKQGPKADRETPAISNWNATKTPVLFAVGFYFGELFYISNPETVYFIQLD
jgi:hypothetical protein